MSKFTTGALCAASVACLFAVDRARAAPIVCTSTLVISGQGGFENDSSLGAGVCVQTVDAIYGNFNLGNLPLVGSVDFNVTNVGTPLQAYHGISFNDNYVAGVTYATGYSVEIASGTNLLDGIKADFTQTNGTSTLMTSATESGTGSIDETKISTTPSGADLIQFSPGYTQIDVSNTLTDNGSITSITNTSIENGPVALTPVPEPGSMPLVISGVFALGFLSWRHGRRALAA